MNGGVCIRHTANIITFLRIPLSVAMIFSPPFSLLFWSMYICSGLSDLLDGFVARKLHQQSEFGAKLDSISDSVFAVSIAVCALKYITFPFWIWICIIVIALIRFIGYGLGFYKYNTFASLHTYSNKITGLLIFISPLIYLISGLTVTSLILIIFSLFSSVEEILITIKCKNLSRNIKGIFIE